MLRMFPVVTAFAALIVGGVVHGIWTDRWRTNDEAEAWAARLAKVPMNVGEWQGEDQENKGTQIGGVSGTLYRRYVNRAGQAVNVFLVCGRAGPVAIHTPNDCYVAAGYEMLSQVRCNSRPAKVRPRPCSGQPSFARRSPPTRRSCASSGRGVQPVPGKLLTTRGSSSAGTVILPSTRCTSCANGLRG